MQRVVLMSRANSNTRSDRHGVGGSTSTGWNGTTAFRVLAGATANGDVPESATVGPVTAAGLAEVAGLREVVVVVVTELGVGGFTTWARKLLLFSCRVLRGDPLVAAAAAAVRSRRTSTR